MACSKLFSGELSELTNEIIQYLRKDFSTLYSCILVNRLWCRLTIPLLWEDTFSIKKPKNYHFIEIYLHFLNEDNKAKFNEYCFNNVLEFTNTLFNHPSFIKYLDTNKICGSIVNWISTLVEIYNEKLGELVYESLLEVFIEYEVNLHTFEVVLLPVGIYKYSIDNMRILQNQNLTCNIRNLTLNFFVITTQDILYLKFLYCNCKSISSFVIRLPKNNDDSLLIEKVISQMIISQNDLKKILFGYSNPFLSLKNSNCSNTF
ncbi:unnamed protein product [Rhizophagus irregularis]|nr:unnamed protein product [Rhizophagus irregularis]